MVPFAARGALRREPLARLPPRRRPLPGGSRASRRARGGFHVSSPSSGRSIARRKGLWPTSGVVAPNARPSFRAAASTPTSTRYQSRSTPLIEAGRSSAAWFGAAPPRKSFVTTRKLKRYTGNRGSCMVHRSLRPVRPSVCQGTLEALYPLGVQGGVLLRSLHLRHPHTISPTMTHLVPLGSPHAGRLRSRIARHEGRQRNRPG